MATLVLTVVGSVIGGPIGGALGAAIGQTIDQAVLFRPKGREGPRLTELAVQTSSYGTPIPQVFGTMRVAGSVIWATELEEHRTTGGGGKGRRSTTSYSYTASFAVALSSRPVLGVRRIWADGKLLRGAGGDFKSATGFRLHLGSEAQAPDPLIASAEGQVPAHRGVAYAVFEDLELADFGNRIPSLTFEVEADAGPVSAGAVAEALSEGLVEAGEVSLPLQGFSAYGNLRSVIELLADSTGAVAAADGDRVRLLHGEGDPREVADLGMGGGDGPGERGKRTLAAADAAPRRVTVAHYDPARDYQAGVQRAMRAGPGTRERRIELPATLPASAAKSVAEDLLARAELARERRALALGWEALDIAPGASVRIAGEAGPWRVMTASFERMVVALELARIAPASVPASASSGRVLGAPDLVHGTTLLHGFEVPPLEDVPPSSPRLLISAAGTGAGWRRAALLLSVDGGSWDAIGGTAAPAVIGTLTVAPGPASSTRVDEINAIEVMLAHPGMALSDADAAALDRGANLALVGEELVQFARAEPLGGNSWRLRTLWRGRRATEAAIGTQLAGDRFVLLTSQTLLSAELPPTSIGGIARLLGSGVGDLDAPAETFASISGCSVRPPAPVHLRARLEDDGGATLSWVRRSRAGWRWVDAVDVPLVEEREAYAVELVRGDGSRRGVETAMPLLEITADDRATGPLSVAVRQIGSHAVSLPASMIVAGLGGE